MKLPVNYNKIPFYQRRIVREEYIKLQEGKCYYCKYSLNEQPSNSVLNKKINKKLFPLNFFNWPIHLHHDHTTGMTIGAVHCHCNAILWQFHGE
jgi:hypothetical protein